MLKKEGYLGKKIKIIGQCGSNHNLQFGDICTLKSFCSSGINVKRDSDGNNQTLYGGEWTLLEDMECEEKGFKKLFFTDEVKDEYGLKCVLRLEPDEETMYLSSGLRSILEVKANDRINVAVDSEKEFIYICKELDNNCGLVLQENGTINGIAVYRNIYIHAPEIKEFSFDCIRIKNSDYPDYTFFRLGILQENKSKEVAPKKAATKRNSSKEIIPPKYFWDPVDELVKDRSINTPTENANYYPETIGISIDSDVKLSYSGNTYQIGIDPIVDGNMISNSDSINRTTSYIHPDSFMQTKSKSNNKKTSLLNQISTQNAEDSFQKAYDRYQNDTNLIMEEKANKVWENVMKETFIEKTPKKNIDTLGEIDL